LVQRWLREQLRQRGKFRRRRIRRVEEERERTQKWFGIHLDQQVRLVVEFVEPFEYQGSCGVSAFVIDGTALADETLREVASRVAACVERRVLPGLAVVLVGEDPASLVYVRNKSRKATQVGIVARDLRLPGDSSTASLLALVSELNADRAVHGILIQLPLPSQIDAQTVLAAVDPAKDVDGFHPDNLGRLMLGIPRFVACTPQGCMLMIERAGTQLDGARALVIGRSTIVGKPMAQLLLQANATVTMAHSRTNDLRALVGMADVVVAAVGRANMVRGEWIAKEATVIDVGMNRGPDGKLCGDVEYDVARQRARAISPVPGGVGPMTIACLMRNVVLSAERTAGLA